MRSNEIGEAEVVDFSSCIFIFLLKRYRMDCQRGAEVDELV